jgi:hypothetical protein
MLLSRLYTNWIGRNEEEGQVTKKNTARKENDKQRKKKAHERNDHDEET